MEPNSFLKTTALRGFTLVEMIVVLAIIVIITTIAVTGQQNFDKTLTITDSAYTIALTLREAQVFGLSSRLYNSVTNAGYGVHFSPLSTSHVLFADINNTSPILTNCPVGTAGTPDAKPGNCRYDSTQGETLQTFTFTRGFKITNICGYDQTSNLHCSATNGTAIVDLTGADVVFTRPNTNSIVTGIRTGSVIPLRDLDVTLSSLTAGSYRHVCVTSVGEVSVSATTCP